MRRPRLSRTWTTGSVGYLAISEYTTSDDHDDGERRSRLVCDREADGAKTLIPTGGQLIHWVSIRPSQQNKTSPRDESTDKERVRSAWSLRHPAPASERLHYWQRPKWSCSKAGGYLNQLCVLSIVDIAANYSVQSLYCIQVSKENQPARALHLCRATEGMS